ncbi:hypothetical protein L345_11689, partial [Ophiophagus hannah]
MAWLIGLTHCASTKPNTAHLRVSIMCESSGTSLHPTPLNSERGFPFPKKFRDVSTNFRASSLEITLLFSMDSESSLCKHQPWLVEPETKARQVALPGMGLLGILKLDSQKRIPRRRGEGGGGGEKRKKKRKKKGKGKGKKR